jgi:hypothetical protein
MKDISKMILAVALFIAISNALPVAKNLPALPKMTGDEILSGQSVFLILVAPIVPGLILTRVMAMGYYLMTPRQLV